MDAEAAITVTNLSKSFKLPHERTSSIKSLLINASRRKKGYETQHVLNNVSFRIKKGEFFGIVGRNGSGKSTLLKILAGIYTPDQGEVRIAGKLTPFIELGVGFNPELTGRENVYLNGALLGFSRREIAKMYDNIVDFAEIERFMDQKLKNYSSGMQVRLAFSVAICARSDVVLLDEVLAVGDEAFQRKCYSYFERLKQEKQTIILVSHDMASMQRFCDRIMVMDRGTSLGVFNASEATALYTSLNYDEEIKYERKKRARISKKAESEPALPYKGTVLRNLLVCNETVSTKKTVLIRAGERLEIRVTLQVPKALAQQYNNLLCSLSFYDENKAHITGMNSGETTISSDSKEVHFIVDRSPFPSGLYEIRVGLFGQDGERFILIDYVDDGIYFSGYGAGKELGMLLTYGRWSTSVAEERS